MKEANPEILEEEIKELKAVEAEEVIRSLKIEVEEEYLFI